MVRIKAIDIFVVLVLFNWVSSYHPNTTLRDRIPLYLQELCPGSGVCLNDNFDPENNVSSCCGACSCSDGCEKEGNCCFQSHDNNTLDTTMPSTRHYSECLYPIANNFSDAFSNNVFKSYHMVSSTADDAINGRTNDSINCGEVRVAPWGSLYPLYSKSTGKIYKNSVCADAHNVIDGELWMVYFSCNQFDIFQHVQNDFIPDQCVVKFFYEGEISLLNSESCYHTTDYIATCIENMNIIPPSSSIASEEIVAACESGLTSPYEDVYINVFCYICDGSGLPLEDQSKCVDNDDKSGTDKSFSMAAFTILFDANAFSQTLVEDNVQNDHDGNTRTACPRESAARSADGCRTISCPTGQVFSRGKGCIYTGNKWYLPIIHISVNLSSERPINVSSLYSSIQNLKSPWPNSWIIDLVVYETTDVPMQTRNILVIQYVQFKSPFNPTSFFSMVEDSVSKPWRLVSKDGEMMLDSKMSSIERKPIKAIYVQPGRSHRIKTRINKFFFCDHVILLPSEYSIEGWDEGFDNPLFNKITNTTLYDWKFKTVDNEGDQLPAICLDDSGFYRVAPNNSIKNLPKMSLMIIVLLTVMQIII